jgi:hypothetical protein
MRLVATSRLRQLLPAQRSDGSRWRLGEHIEEIQATENDAFYAFREMITIGEEVVELLLTKSGLYVNFPPPDSADQFIAYVKLLRVASDQGHNQSAAELVNFPNEFSSDIRAAIEKIRSRLAQLDALPGDAQA